MDKVTGRHPVNIIPIRRSPWAIVVVDLKADARKLVQQKVVFDPTKNTLIVFREPAFKATLDRAFEILNIQVLDDLHHFEKTLTDKNSTIVSQSPTLNEWKSTYVGRTIWKTKAPTTGWKIPVKVHCPSRNTLLIRLAPVCGICHGDDHPTPECRWKEVFPKVGSRQSRNRTNLVAR